MKSIYCFMEREGTAWEDFVKKYDSQFEIHVYSSILGSCGNDLLPCMTEIFSIFWENEEKSWFVTDVKELYDIVQELDNHFFDRIIYLEQNVPAILDLSFDVCKMMDLEVSMVTDELTQKLINLLKSATILTDYDRFSDLSAAIGFGMQTDEFKKCILFIHICRSVFYAAKQEEIEMSEEYRIFLMSLLMKLEKNTEMANDFLRLVLASDKYQEDNYYFVWNQYKDISLKRRVNLDNTTQKLRDRMYQCCYNLYYEKVKNKVHKIPLVERRKNCVLVLTIQYLDNTHAPTNTLRERCKTLRKLGKEVYIVNTTEQSLYQGYIPFYQAAYGNVFLENNEKKEIEIDGESFAFLQLSADDTILERFVTLYELIQKIKPYYILSIGTGSILADLCGNIVPCASMALAFSTFPHTVNCMRILGRNLRQGELDKKETEKIIESRFTFELKPQKKHFMREQYQISENCFVLAVIGIRLDYEVTSDFCQVLSDVCVNGAFVVFAGIFDTYEKVMKENVILAKNSTFIGYCDDMLALMEICDLYVNPKRLGGGFSIIEAFEKGVPGVYLRTGDVYTAGGEEYITPF